MRWLIRLAVGVTCLGCAVWVLEGVATGAYTPLPDVIFVGAILVAAAVASLMTMFDAPP